jgi:GNAT superfamily N-acetyltransferase
MENIYISTDKSKLDITFIHNFISNSYWANGRSLAAMQTCINNSLNFGIYLDEKQVGYARLVSDYGQFAYIMDVFVDENYRGKGYSKMLMKYILEFELLKNVKVWRLATNDAHGLYEQFGFKPLAHPQFLMEKFC